MPTFIKKKIIQKSIIFITMKENRNNLFGIITKSKIKASKFDTTFSNPYKKQEFVERKDEKTINSARKKLLSAAVKKREKEHLQELQRKMMINKYFLKKYFFRFNYKFLKGKKKVNINLQNNFIKRALLKKKKLKNKSFVRAKLSYNNGIFLSYLLKNYRKNKKNKKLRQNIFTKIPPKFIKNILKILNLKKKNQKKINFFKHYLDYIAELKVFLLSNGIPFRLFLKKYFSLPNFKEISFMSNFHKVFFPLFLPKKDNLKSSVYTPVIQENHRYPHFFAEYYNVKYPIPAYIKSKILSAPEFNSTSSIKKQVLLKFFSTGNLGFKNRNRKIVAASTRLGNDYPFSLKNENI